MEGRETSRKEGNEEGVAGRRETRRVLQEGGRQEGCCRKEGDKKGVAVLAPKAQPFVSMT